MKRLLSLLAALLLTACMVMPATSVTSTPTGKPKILLSMKGPGANNTFWAAVEKGAREAAAAGNVELIVLAPPQETDVMAQISQIEAQLATPIQALIVAPTDIAALIPSFEKAKAANIPVLFVDTDSPWPDKLTFIGTDNRVGGQLAGEFICQAVGRPGKVALITGVLSQQTHIDRSGGAEEAFTACGLTLVAKQAADSLRNKGAEVMNNILTTHPDIVAVFATNDLMALGAMDALHATGKTNVVVVGFDASPEAIAAIRAGKMTASIAQKPYAMGQLGVESAVHALRGQVVQKRIDTGTLLVDKTNVADYLP